MTRVQVNVQRWPVGAVSTDRVPGEIVLRGAKELERPKRKQGMCSFVPRENKGKSELSCFI